MTPEGQYAGHDNKWIYVADSKASAELLVASADGKETLSTDVNFQEARKRVESSGSVMSLYWDLASTVKAAEPLGIPYTDAQTWKDLGSLQYLAVTMDLKGKQSDGFLKVNPDGTTLSQKLLSKGSVGRASFEGLTKKTSVGHAIDLEWTFNTLVAVAMLSPESRQTASMAPMGLALYGNPWAAFEGDVASTGDWIDSLAGTVSSNFGNARGQGQLTACKSNLKNIATASEMYASDSNGRYPQSAAQLIPNYLKTIPECPAAGSDTYSLSYKSSTAPYHYEVACSGDHHRAGDNMPSYTAEDGLIEGAPPMGAAETPEQMPSVVFTASVKDAKLAHGLIAKLLPSAGEEPKVGEEKVYQVPEGTMVMKTAPPGRLLVGVGEKSAALLDTKGGNLADQARLKEALTWAGEGVIYADYLDLRPLVESVKKQMPTEQTSESEAAKAMLSKLNDFELEGASCLVAREDGLYWRSYGVSTGAMVFGGSIGAAILVPNFIKARSQGQTTACKSNLKNIGTALEMWSVDNGGKYPGSLTPLTPNYLRTIPECPAAARVTYEARFGPTAPMNTEGHADYYYVECAGGNHTEAGLTGNFPAFTSAQGLLEREQ